MIQEARPELSSQSEKTNQLNRNHETDWALEAETNRASRLIAFPGATRSVPEWRKQLSQRVREVQEKKAREAAEELAAAQEAGLVSCALPSGQLELVPDLEQPVMNPIVSKALERLERARRSEAIGSAYGAGTAAAAALAEIEDPRPEDIESQMAAKPRLTVVVAPSGIDSPYTVEREEFTITAEPELGRSPIAEKADRKPVRMISEDDVALSYLDTCLSLPALDGDTRADLPGLSRRFLGGVLDLMFIALMVSPAFAAVYYTGGRWSDRSVIEMLSGVTAATMFAYMTVSIALTGRTLAMRMLALKTIDLRTGLIPTGGQAIKRAIGFVFSFALLGLGQAYALVDPDRRTVYDRISNTIVVRA
jgi:uncharacterized RDD family membrane protein YckC